MKLKALLLSLITFSTIAIYYVGFGESESQTYYITESVKRMTIDKHVLATGSVRASQRIEVGAQVSGKITQLYVTLGQAVKKGDLIAEIDASNQSNSLNTAEAHLVSYHAKLKSAQVALDIAQSSYQRLNQLYKNKSATLNEVENAKQQLASAKASVDEIKSQIKSAQISVNDAKTNLSYAQIISPMDGIIVSVPVSVGETVNANQASPTIVQVANLETMLIKLEISESDIPQIKVGQAVTFTTLADPQYHYQSKIESVDPALTNLTDNNYKETSGNTSAVYYYVNTRVDNPENRLRIGMTVQGQISIIKRENVLAVPTSALQKHENQIRIQVLKHGKVEERVIQIGVSNSQYTEVLDGISENEQIIMTQRSNDEQVSRQPRRRSGF